MVTGLAVEQRCLQRLPGAHARSVLCFGPGPEAAEKAASRLLDEGCGALMSFGIAGALDPRLRPGSVVLAEAVVSERDDVFTTDTAWCRRLRACCGADPSVWTGRVLGCAGPLLSPLAKREAANRYSALAVDMESQAVARIAERGGIPFMSLRAVADPVERGIPAFLVGMIDGRGKPRFLTLALATVAHVRDVPKLIRLARDQRAALHALRRIALGAGPLLALR